MPDVLFITTATETFTPTQSGAIATVLHGLALAAVADGVQPLIVARGCDAAPYADVPAIFFAWADGPSAGLPLTLARCERKLRGWTRLRQGRWMTEMAQMLEPYRRVPWLLNNEPELAVYLRRRFPDAHIVHHFHNQLPAKAQARRQYPRSVNATAAISRFTAGWVERFYELPPGSVTVAHNAVDLNHFSPAPSGLPAGRPVLNFVGRTGIEKAPDLLLKAALELTRTTTDFAVQIVGSNHWDGYSEDNYQRELRQLADTLRQRGVEMTATGHVARADLPDVIRRAHIHVVPSRWDEPFGLTTLEGMACGLAVVASNTGGTPEVVGKGGLLFERDSVADLVNVLVPLIADRTSRDHRGRACRRQAERFTWHRTWAILAPVLTSGRQKPSIGVADQGDSTTASSCTSPSLTF